MDKPAHKKIVRQDSSDSVTKMCEKYIISTNIIGIGGYSKVFEACFQSDPDYKVAIKAIPKQKVE